MNLELLTEPVIQFALLAFGLALCLYLFVSVQRRTVAFERRMDEEVQVSRAEFQELQGVLRELRDKLERDEEREGDGPSPPNPVARISLQKRKKALELSTQGKTPAEIAETLELPLQEVDLMLKIRRLAAKAE